MPYSKFRVNIYIYVAMPEMPEQTEKRNWYENTKLVW